MPLIGLHYYDTNRVEKKRTEHSSSVPDQDRRFISPGPRALKKAAHCTWGPGGRTVRDGINAEAKFTNDLRPACVCPVSPPCIHVCCSESLVRLKSDNYIIIIQEGEVH